nr:uncharacterized protein LOC113840883 isoform X4 [Anas platyrhynchos]
MLGQAPWARLSPSGPAVLLLVICGSMSSQDICSSPGDLPAPAFQMNLTSAQPGTTVVLQCILHVFSHTRRIIFCKDGKEVYSQEAQQGQLSYFTVLNITSRSAGRYTCGYQQRNEMKQRRSSALSAGRILNVPGNVVSSPASPSPPGMALAVAAIGLVLLAAGSWFAIRKGACRGRCPRQQHVDSPQTEDTNYGDIQYSTIAHVRRDRPPPMQQMSDTTTYATVTRTQTR